MGWVQILQRAEFSRRTGKNQPSKPPWSWDESPSVAPFVLQRPFHPKVIVCKSIQQTRTRFHTGSGSNTPGRIKQLPPLSYQFISRALSTPADDAWFGYSVEGGSPMLRDVFSPTSLRCVQSNIYLRGCQGGGTILGNILFVFPKIVGIMLDRTSPGLVQY